MDPKYDIFHVLGSPDTLNAAQSQIAWAVTIKNGFRLVPVAVDAGPDGQAVIAALAVTIIVIIQILQMVNVEEQSAQRSQ